MRHELLVAVIRGAPTFITAATTLALGWLVGLRLTDRWKQVKQRWELDLATVNDFYKLYGEFFCIWKLWNAHTRHLVMVKTVPADLQWQLLERASDAEGRIEAVLVKLAVERKLLPADEHVLGSFREAYQTLRETIRAGKDLGWHGSEHPEYLAFKGLATYVATLLPSARKRDAAPATRAAVLQRITTHAYRRPEWQRLAQRYGLASGGPEDGPQAPRRPEAARP